MALKIDSQLKLWQMRKNCCLTPKQLFIAYFILLGFSSAVTTGFVLAGVWMVLVFAVIELTAVTLAFLIYSIHALDREEIQLVEQRLIVRQVNGNQEVLHEFNPKWAKIKYPLKGKKLFALCESKREVELGQFLLPKERNEVVRSLRAHLGRDLL